MTLPPWLSHNNIIGLTLCATRVGGGTQDGVIYYPVFPANPGYVSTFPAVPAGATSKQLFPEASSTKAGYNYYLCAGNMPNGTAFTWGVNFASGNMSETVAQVQVVDRAFAVSPYKIPYARGSDFGL